MLRNTRFYWQSVGSSFPWVRALGLISELASVIKPRLGVYRSSVRLCTLGVDVSRCPYPARGNRLIGDLQRRESVPRLRIG